MTSLSASPVTRTTSERRFAVATVAWIGTLAVSGLPVIVPVETLGVDPWSLRWLSVGLAAVLVVVSAVWRPASALRGYFAVMLAVVVATFVATPLLTSWIPTTLDPPVVRALAVKAVFFAVAIAVASFLVFALRQRPRDVYLTAGDLRAPSSVRLPGMRRPLTWSVVGPVTAIGLAAGFALQMFGEGAFSAAGVAQLPGLAVVVLATACCNALAEEVIFRAGPLGFLSRVVGPRQAVLMTSVWFGLGHYYGSVPSGPVGAVQSGVLALLLGAAMVETRGLAWPLLIHIALDVVVFASIAAAI